MKRFSSEFNEAVISRYKENALISDIFKEFCLDSRGLAKIRAEAQIPRRKRVSAHCYRKYSFNTHFFDLPETWTEDQAYWLGWLYSDGYNCLRNGSIRIKIQEKDAVILEMLKKIISYTGPLNFVKTYPSSIKDKKPMRKIQNQLRLTITNRVLSEQLSSLGVNNDKSTRTGCPKQLPSNLYRHFIRGLWDGDGCFGRSSSKNKFFSNLHVNPVLAQWVKQTLEDDVGIYCGISSARCNDIVCLKVSGNRQICRLAAYLYKDASFCLPRKLEKVLELYSYKASLGNTSDKQFILSTYISLKKTLSDTKQFAMT